MNEEPDIVCSATLMVLGDDLIPEKITEQIGLEPNQSWRRGERKSFIRNDGTVHYFDDVHEWGGWKCFIPKKHEALELEEMLAWWCDLLEGRESQMRELEGQGYWLEMNCFVAMSETVTIEVSADLQQRLASFRLNLSIRFSPDALTSSGAAEQFAQADRE